VTGLTSVGRDALNLLFPARCAACEAACGPRGDGLCAACRAGLEHNFRQSYCPRCGSTVGPYGASDGRCSHCRGRSVPVGGIVRLGTHDGPLRDLLLAFKYAGREELDRRFGRWLAERLRAAPWFGELEAIAPVPTCWHRHLLGRPYVATELARQLARAADLPDLPLLRRIRGGPSQVGLTYTQRLENVRGAFRLAPGVRLDRAVVCLVDDVTTTGATLAECARVLRRSGAARVYAAVVCKQ